jgi:hypothetical protein
MLEVIALLAALGDGPGFFERREVDFWNARRRKAEPSAELWADSTAPPPVRQLLEAPTAENARAYLAWQEARMSRLKAAMAAVEAARGPAPILYFSREGCRWCALQEEELRDLDVVRVPPGSPLWKQHGVTATPTLVVDGKVFRGYTPRAALMKEMRRE